MTAQVTTKWIQGDLLEYCDETHTYICNGVILPSVTQILAAMFGDKYSHVSQDVLSRAASRGTAMHEAIQRYCEEGLESDSEELRNFKFLQKQYDFSVVACEKPVIIYRDGPVAAGRLDMVIEMGGQKGLADLKRTATLDKDYLAYQLNLYRIGFQQSYCYGIDFLRGIHLRDDVRKFVEIPVDESLAWEAYEKWMWS